MFDLSPFEFWSTISSFLSYAILVMFYTAVILLLVVWVTLLVEQIIVYCRDVHYKLPKLSTPEEDINNKESSSEDDDDANHKPQVRRSQRKRKATVTFADSEQDTKTD